MSMQVDLSPVVDWDITRLKREVLKYLKETYGVGGIYFTITVETLGGTFLFNDSSMKKILDWGKEYHEWWLPLLRKGEYVKKYVLEYGWDDPDNPGGRDNSTILHYGTSKWEALAYYYIKNIYKQE